MPANTNHIHEWGDEYTVTLPRYRILAMGGDCGPLIHVTPEGHHLVDMDCDGVCLVCNHALEAMS